MRQKLRLAFYIRLSQEDISKIKKIKEESASISNQRELLQYTYNSRKDLSCYEVIEFIDDGYSGINFHRPSFQKMIEEVKKGKIQCIMVKDFSRFARNFLDMGEYLEQIFPFLGVRFISVNDHYDSQDNKKDASDWDIVFQNFLYDLYSKDLSKKVKSGKMAKARRGEYMGSPPIGYIRSKQKKNQLEIEPEGAKIVRFIFDMALQGKKIPQIVMALNQSQLPTPGVLAEKFKKTDLTNRRKNKTVICWEYSMVRKILKNPVYTGAAVNFKREKKTPCSIHTQKKKEEDWVIVPNCHEAIITQEEYERAMEQSRTVKNKRGIKADNPHRTILSGICKCGYCNRTMRYRYRASDFDIFFCATTMYANIPITKTTCDKRYYMVEEINQVVLKAIKYMGNMAEKKYSAIKFHHYNEGQETESLEQEITHLHQKIFQKKVEKQKYYEMYYMEEIDKEEYLTKKRDYDNIIKAIEEQIVIWKKKQIQYSNIEGEDLQTIKNLSYFAPKTELTREVVEYLIKEIRIYRENRYEIIWNFKNIFNIYF